MMLHTLSAAPGTPGFDSCLRVAAPADRILLLGDGVYAAIAGSPGEDRLQGIAAAVFALSQDVAAAGISRGISERVEVIDFDGFVALTEACERQLNWD
jgi:tRNA 2-thiouridine synthesizing protein B